MRPEKLVIFTSGPMICFIIRIMRHLYRSFEQHAVDLSISLHQGFCVILVGFSSFRVWVFNDCRFHWLVPLNCLKYEWPLSGSFWPIWVSNVSLSTWLGYWMEWFSYQNSRMTKILCNGAANGTGTAQHLSFWPRIPSNSINWEDFKGFLVLLFSLEITP